jgi:FkbM family methyltransferase
MTNAIPSPGVEHSATSNARSNAKVRAFSVAAAGLRVLLQCVPSYRARRLLWNGIARPYVAWRPLRKDAISRFGARFSLWLPDVIQRHIYFFGVWEPAITHYLAGALADGDIFVDVGANIGYHALLAAGKVGARGRVYAIEASPTIFTQLSHNISANGAANILALNMAATDRPMTVSVFLHDEENTGATTIMADVAKKRLTKLEAEVEGKPLKALIPLADLLNARLIKIDVEGAEWSVLQGFRDLLPQLSARTEILIEVNAEALRDAGASVGELVGMFEAAGFTPYFVPNPYDTEELYLRTRVPRIEPPSNLAFDQADLLFRRTHPDTPRRVATP